MKANQVFTKSYIDSGEKRWTAEEIESRSNALASVLKSKSTRVLATLLDNTPAWIVADTAARIAQVVHVPLPVFFTPAQMAHALKASGADSLLTISAMASKWPGISASPYVIGDEHLVLLDLPSAHVDMPSGTAKVTFTSGTTGNPKGVCLSADAMNEVVNGLLTALRPLDIKRHLCALPFAVLLEDIAGLQAPLRNGATCVVLPLNELGLGGSSSFDVERFHSTVERVQPESLILLPQMLRAWSAWLAAKGRKAPQSLKFVAVGGGAVGEKLLSLARCVGIPAYEGYGLSEGASVQSLNLPGSNRSGSVGKTLPHARIRVASDGEIEVTGSLFTGYLGEAFRAAEWWPTGDLGHVDPDGFLHIDGRKKNLLITAFGRNVSPEWVETTLRNESAVYQAVVLGDGQPTLSAVLWPSAPDILDSTIQSAIDTANASLPDYARINAWTRAKAPFLANSGMATANGRPRRDQVLALHSSELSLP